MYGICFNPVNFPFCGNVISHSLRGCCLISATQLTASGTAERTRLDQALAAFNTRTGGCVKWVARSNEANYVAITGRQEGCFAWVGLLNDGRQELNLQPGNPGCLNISPGTAEHEMLHALGTFHEHSRPDR